MEEYIFVSVEIPATRSASTFDPRFLYLRVLSDHLSAVSALKKTITESRYDGAVTPEVLCASPRCEKAAATLNTAEGGAEVCSQLSGFLSDAPATQIPLIHK